MERMNIFNPYVSKDPGHEDHLTKAYLVLLKHSPHVFFSFFEYCRSNLTVAGDEQALTVLDYLQDDWIIETQKTNPDIETDGLLSVLITDENPHDNQFITPSDRNARYDGIITFGDKLTMIIENKPRSTNVWFDQLNPSKQNLHDEIKIYRNPVILYWKEIIKHLGFLRTISTISGFEKNMIDDFLAFVDEHHLYLNPFDRFSLCKGDSGLLNRRIENLLKSIVKDTDIVDEQRRWGYIITLPFELIRMAGLILENYNRNDNNWRLELSLTFGATQNLAKDLYKSNPDISMLNKLESEGWSLHNDFRVAKNAGNLVAFKSDMDLRDYIQYWVENTDIIAQCKNQGKVKNLLNRLNSLGIINYDNERQKEMNKKYFDTNMQKLNICPGITLIYKIQSNTALELDNEKDELGVLLIKKLKQGLAFAGINCEDIFKQI